MAIPEAVGIPRAIHRKKPIHRKSSAPGATHPEANRRSRNIAAVAPTYASHLICCRSSPPARRYRTNRPTTARRATKKDPAPPIMPRALVTARSPSIPSGLSTPGASEPGPRRMADVAARMEATIPQATGFQRREGSVPEGDSSRTSRELLPESPHRILVGDDGDHQGQPEVQEQPADRVAGMSGSDLRSDRGVAEQAEDQR